MKWASLFLLLGCLGCTSAADQATATSEPPALDVPTTTTTTPLTIITLECPAIGPERMLAVIGPVFTCSNDSPTGLGGRAVERPGVNDAESAILAWVDGPTSQEQAAGLSGWDFREYPWFADSLTLRREGSTLTIDLARWEPINNFSTFNGTAVFITSLLATAFSDPTVEIVDLTILGNHCPVVLGEGEYCFPFSWDDFMASNPPTLDDIAPSPGYAVAADAVPESELPGAAVTDWIFAPPRVSVVGVDFDDVLNVRRLPDPGSEIVTRLAPTTEGITSTGRIRRIAESSSRNSLWLEVATTDGAGWVNSAYVAVIGGPGDRPNETDWFLTARADGVMPAGASVAEVVDRFAALMTDWEANYYPDDDFGSTPRSAIVTDPSDFKLDGVIVDIRSFGDDASAGSRYRLDIVVTPTGFALDRVTTLGSICSRGGQPGGSCL